MSSPILGRKDDWPLTWAGDRRPYYDYLLIVFSGDDVNALTKRENMRKVVPTRGRNTKCNEHALLGALSVTTGF